MTEFQSNGKHYLAVTVPTYRKYFIDKTNAVVGTNSNSDIATCRQLAQLPEGQYSILGLASEMSEEQAQSIGINGKWILNQNIEASTSKVAVIMFIRSLNLNPETTLIIEKR